MMVISGDDSHCVCVYVCVCACACTQCSTWQDKKLVTLFVPNKIFLKFLCEFPEVLASWKTP